MPRKKASYACSIVEMISSGSGNRPISFFEKTFSPSTVTSNIPPDEGTSSKLDIFCLKCVNSFSARPAAFGA